MNHTSSDTFLRLPEVKKRTGLSRSTIYLYIKRGLFPSPIKISVRCSGWVESEIGQWIESRRKVMKDKTELKELIRHEAQPVSSFIHDGITVHLVSVDAVDNNEIIGDFFILYKELYKMHSTLAEREFSEDALMLLENCLISIVRKFNALGYEISIKDTAKK